MKRVVLLVLPIILSSYVASTQLRIVLTQEMLNGKGDVFSVKRDYDLDGKTLTLPKGKKLVFKGGSLDGGVIVGNQSGIQVDQSRPAFGKNLVISGTWDVREVYDSWFDFDPSEDFVSNQIINNLLAFTDDESPCHIFFNEDRTYFFELPYKGRADVGNMVPSKVVNGKTKRNYSEIFEDSFSFLRIFTIPSNTHVTINSKLKMLPTNLGAYFVFWEYGKQNIRIDGKGEISGENDWHKYDTYFSDAKSYGEWGNLFRCLKCSGFSFKDITVSDAFGDCIIYSGSRYADEKDERWSSDLTLENVKVLRARRNGVAVGARNVIIRGCHFEGCGTKQVRGTSPRCGIDFEPDGIASFPEVGNENVLMENCTFKDNYYDVSTFKNNLNSYGKVATTVRNCIFHSPLRLQDTSWMLFENCYIPFLYNTKDKSSKMLYSTHMTFKNCEFGELDMSTVVRGKIHSNKFVDCKYNTAPKSK